MERRLRLAYDKLPLSFETQGEFGPIGGFLCRAGDFSVFLTSAEAVFQPRIAKANPSIQHSKRDVLRMRLVGANSVARAVGIDELPGKSNYFIGNDSRKWRTNVATFAKVRFVDVYPGIDLVYYGDHRQLEYDFVVAPGADPAKIKLWFLGADNFLIDPHGDFFAKTASGQFRHRRPSVYQEADGVRNEIAGRYVLDRVRDAHLLGFQLDEYDVTKPLVIDPVLIYSSYLGGNNESLGYAVAVDGAGNAYLTGHTASTNFPTVNPLQQAVAGPRDVFVSKIDASGSRLVYSTYLGGAGQEIGCGIATDAAGNVYLTGRTDSSNFPLSNPFQPALGGTQDAFVTKLSPTGSSLVYSTYLGGATNSDEGHRIVVDASGRAYVTGATYSTDFPTTTGAFQTSNQGEADAFVTKLSSTGSALIFSTYLGGSNQDNIFAEFDINGGDIAIDPSGHAYVTGITLSTNFPTVNAFQATLRGPTDAFVTKLNPAGSGLVYSTFLGGSLYDWAHGIAVDAAGNAYVGGRTESFDFPTVNALQPVLGGGADTFLAKLSTTSSSLLFSTYLGGDGGERCNAVLLDPSGNIYMTGGTRSLNFPTTADAFQITKTGSFYDAFITKLNPEASSILYSTYLGGTMDEGGIGMAIDANNIYVAGFSGSSDFPTVNAFQHSLGGGRGAAFAAKIEILSPILEIQLGSLIYGNGQSVTITEFRFKNPRTSLTKVETKVWLQIPSLPPVVILNLGADGSFVLPAQFDQSIGPLTLMTVTSETPRGSYGFSSRMLEPVTGKLISQDLNSFEVQ